MREARSHIKSIDLWRREVRQVILKLFFVQPRSAKSQLFVHAQIRRPKYHFNLVEGGFNIIILWGVLFVRADQVRANICKCL